MTWRKWPGWWWVQSGACLGLTLVAVWVSWRECYLWGIVGNAFFGGMVANAMLYRPMVMGWRRMIDESHDMIGRSQILINSLLTELESRPGGSDVGQPPR